MAPPRRITGFRQDAEGHWIAELDCGHSQHMRHNPPWERRPWILEEGTRLEKVGTSVECPLCRAPFSRRQGA